METRFEHDSMGQVAVPADKYWGAQTQRSRENFPIGVGRETMPLEVIHAFGILKKGAALANAALRPDKMRQRSSRRSQRPVMRSFPARWTRIFPSSCGRPVPARRRI